MLDILPAEVLDLVVHYSTKETQARLSIVSHGAYFISVRALYASIPDMNVTRTTQCLLTLSKKPDLAHLVHSFCLHLSSSPYFLRAFLTLLSRALSNMNNLRVLSLEVDIPIALNFLDRMSCQLKKLSCILLSKGSYVSQLLSSQPTIEELHLVCRSDDMSTISPEALPALKSLTAPNRLLPILLTSRLTRLSRLCVPDIMISPLEFILLSGAFGLSPPPESIELTIRLQIGPTLKTEAIPSALGLLGKAARPVSSLRLDTYGGFIGQEELQNMFASTLPIFPKLKTLTIMSQLPTSAAHTIRNPPQSQPAQTLLGSDHSFSEILIFMSNAIGIVSSVLTEASALQAESAQTQSQPNPTVDALHDSSCHLEIIKAWRRVHPGLERVVFPVGVYVLKETGWE